MHKIAKRFKLMQHGLLYEMGDSEPRLCIPADRKLRGQILHDHHDAPMAGHLGEEKTLASVKRHYFWPKMTRDIRRYVKTCDSCQRNKPSNHRSRRDCCSPCRSRKLAGSTSRWISLWSCRAPRRDTTPSASHDSVRNTLGRCLGRAKQP